MRTLYFIFLLVVIFQGVVLAQTDKEKQEVRAEMWSAGSAAFSGDAFPEEWNSENAVMLAKKIDYAIHKRSLISVLDESLSMHIRVKVLNNDGIQDFSELEFEVPMGANYGRVMASNMTVQFFFGAKVEKSNGKTIELKESDLVKLELTSRRDRYTKYKIAIPDLESGDIIDYYYKISVPHVVQKYFESPAFDFLLAGKYPIVHQEYNILYNRNCTINAESYNGAPAFTQLAADNNYKHYQIKDTKRAKYKGERWTYDYLNMPFFKFQTYFSKGSGSGNAIFANTSEKQKQLITKEQLALYGNQVTNPLSQASIIEQGAMHDYMKPILKVEKDPVKIAEAAYYFLRNNNMASAYEYELLLNRSLWEQINETYVIGLLSRYLKAVKVNHELVFTTGRQSGFTINNLLFKEDLRLLLAVIDAKGNRTYLTNFTRYSNPNELFTNLEGMPAYAYNMMQPFKKRVAQEITLPWSGSEQNKEINQLLVSLNLDSDPHYTILRDVSATGHRKWGVQNRLVTGFEYLNACATRNLTLDLERFCRQNGIGISKEDRRNIEVKRDQIKADLMTSYKEEYEKSLQSEFSATGLKLETVSLLQAGIFSESPIVSYQDKFTLPELIQRAGPNYLLEIGKLIGGQMAIEEKEAERTNDIQLGHAREFEYKIELLIPQGYRVEGIERLNMNVQNASGIFISKATQEGDKLLITTRKAYLKPIDSKENWNDMRAFLDAAYQFSQQKVLLKSLQARK